MGLNVYHKAFGNEEYQFSVFIDYNKNCHKALYLTSILLYKRSIAITARPTQSHHKDSLYFTFFFQVSHNTFHTYGFRASVLDYNEDHNEVMITFHNVHHSTRSARPLCIKKTTIIHLSKYAQTTFFGQRQKILSPLGSLNSFELNHLFTLMSLSNLRMHSPIYNWGVQYPICKLQQPRNSGLKSAALVLYIWGSTGLLRENHGM